ncbi:glycoside hydrolase family 15 protein [Dactylosporangium sp. CA-052675]|uniref:glycoside hydrolase family 15 protein n=1 Tax=Dactylosporangium sp. CA-052675 TaxID=3239927 RepID=UPI003D89FB64
MPSAIEDYALIGDLHTAALVGRDGSIDWLCLPRFDAPACFAALLGDERHGRWRIAPAAHGAATRRSYAGGSLVLHTEWDTAEGAVRIIDCMPPRGEAADVVRIVEGVRGQVRMHTELVLRFDYGHVTPWLRSCESGMRAIAGPDAAWLSAGVPQHSSDGTVSADFVVSAGQRIPFVLTYQRSHLPVPAPVDPEQALRDTHAFWSDWIGCGMHDGPWAEPVRRSLILLKALTYAPTGGIVAAATTSLPEEPGGGRNWDYRYCWLRDATFTLRALLGTGHVAEAKAWREWLLRAIAGDPADLQIMYGLDGTRRVPESTVDWLPGYRGSSPVRIGNAAASQRQLDVWGEVLDGLHLARESGIIATDQAWDRQRDLLEHLEGHWREPDSSLWEVRGEEQQYVHSKVMAWAGFDRAIRTVERLGLPGPVDAWRRTRAAIHAEVCERGFDSERNTFTQCYGSARMDAALLLIPRVGFLPYDDPRVIGTIDAIQRELCRDGLLMRYRDGREGAFVACSFWLVEALNGIGRDKEAHELFERLLALRNDVGMLAEECDPATGRHLGNTPQAFSLVGLVNAARCLSGARTG